VLQAGSSAAIQPCWVLTTGYCLLPV